MEIAWISRQRKFDLVHDPAGTIPLLLTGVGRVATVHDMIPYVHAQTITRLDWLVYRFWLPLAVGRLDAIITVSD